MRLVIPRSGFLLRSEADRVIIETTAVAEEDRNLDRHEVAKRLNKTTRTIDLYRRLVGEARLRSERYHNRTVIKESEFNRWLKWMQSQKDFCLQEHLDGSASSFRPRKRRRSFVAKQFRPVSSRTVSQGATRPS